MAHITNSIGSRASDFAEIHKHLAARGFLTAPYRDNGIKGATGGGTAVDLWLSKFKITNPPAARTGEKRAAKRFADAVKAQPKTAPKPPSRQVRRRLQRKGLTPA